MRYRVLTYDNFHYGDASECSDAQGYDTAAEATAAAQLIVDKSLRHLYQDGMTPERLYDDYQDFGDDPFIVSDGGKHPFSAWSYAEGRCAAICEELSGRKTPR